MLPSPLVFSPPDAPVWPPPGGPSRRFRRPVNVVDYGADHLQQSQTVIRDDRQQRMLLAGYQRCQRAQRTPHLLALAGPGPPPEAIAAATRTAGSIPSRIACASLRSSGRTSVWAPLTSATPPDLVGNELLTHHPADARPAPCTSAIRTPTELGAASPSTDDQVVVGPAQRQRPGIELGQR